MAQETGQAQEVQPFAFCSTSVPSMPKPGPWTAAREASFQAPMILRIFLPTASYFCPTSPSTHTGNMKTPLHFSLRILQAQKMGVPMKSGLSLTFTNRLAYNDLLPASFSRKWNWPFHLVCLQWTVWILGLRNFQLSKFIVKHRA